MCRHVHEAVKGALFGDIFGSRSEIISQRAVPCSAGAVQALNWWAGQEGREGGERLWVLDPLEGWGSDLVNFFGQGS